MNKNEMLVEITILNIMIKSLYASLSFNPTEKEFNEWREECRKIAEKVIDKVKEKGKNNE